MFKFPKKVEYALLSLQYMATCGDKLVTAKEMSEELNIPFEFLSKTLQTLMKKGLISSQQGIRGGYFLSKEPGNVSINTVLAALGQRANIVDCTSHESNENCDKESCCTLKDPMTIIQRKIDEILNVVTLETLCQKDDQKNGRQSSGKTISAEELLNHSENK